VIRDRRVSRNHAEVFYKNGAPWIRDLGSHNGTVVDGATVEGVQRLRVGARIELHDHAFLLYDAPAECPEELATQFGHETCTSHAPPVAVSFRGLLDQLDLPTVLRALEGTSQSGVLSLVLAKGQKGKVGVRLGRPVWAKLGGLRDEPALIALLRAPNLGRFEFENSNPGYEKPVLRPLDALLLDAVSGGPQGSREAQAEEARGSSANSGLSAEELAAAYRQGVPAKIQALRAALQRTQAGEAEGEAALRSLAHRLRGSGGSYGFPRVSSTAERVELAEPDELVARTEELLELLERVEQGEEGPRDEEQASPDGRARVQGRILLVDDDRDLTSLVSHRLRARGHQVDVFHTGDAALDAFDGGDYSLCLLDVCLPAVSGFELLESIRSRSSVPILMLTARGRESDVVRGFELGAEDYVVKPLRVREFLARVERHLTPHSPTGRQRATTTGSLAGSGGRDQLLELVQLLAGSRRSGRLFLRGQAGSGTLELAEGHLVSTSGAGGPDPLEAALELLDTDAAEFEFVPGDAEAAGARIPLGGLLLEAARRVDERSHAASMPPPALTA